MSNVPVYANEAALEDDLVRRPRELLRHPPRWIARQLHTSANGVIDLLGIDEDGRFVVYELKVNRAGRQTMAQIMDYASWVDAESIDELERRIIQASGKNGIPEIGPFAEHSKRKLRPAKLVIVASEANAALSRMVKYTKKLGLEISVETVRHEVSPTPEIYDIAREFGVAEHWAAALETLDECFDGRGHRLRRWENGVNYELRDQSGSFRSFAGVFVNNRRSGRELGDIFLAIHNATIDQSESEFERLKRTLEGIRLTSQPGSVRMKFYARSREDLTPALREVSAYLIPILDQVQPRRPPEG